MFQYFFLSPKFQELELGSNKTLTQSKIKFCGAEFFAN